MRTPVLILSVLLALLIAAPPAAPPQGPGPGRQAARNLAPVRDRLKEEGTCPTIPQSTPSGVGKNDPTPAQGDEPLDEEGFGAEEAERRIARFVASADGLPGPSVEELADRVAALMRAAVRDIETLMDGKAHNKVLATQLLLGQRARGLRTDDPGQWPLHAATTLLSVLVVRGVDG